MKVKVNTLMYGQFSLATGLSSLLYPTATRVTDLFLYRKLLRFMALRVKLVILASAFVASSIHCDEFLVCPTLFYVLSFF